MFSRKNLDIILSQQNPISCLDLNFQFFFTQKQKTHTHNKQSSLGQTTYPTRTISWGCRVRIICAQLPIKKGFMLIRIQALSKDENCALIMKLNLFGRQTEMILVKIEHWIRIIKLESSLLLKVLIL